MHKIEAALNLRNKSFGQLFGYNLNSIFSFGGRLFGTSDAGFFEIKGVSSGDAPVLAWFETALSDWGTSRLKRPRAIIVSGEFEGAVTVECVDSNGVVLATTDVGDVDSGMDVYVLRKTLPRTSSGRYWKFRIKNKDGSHVSIDGLEVLFTVRPYGTTKNT